MLIFFHALMHFSETSTFSFSWNFMGLRNGDIEEVYGSQVKFGTLEVIDLVESVGKCLVVGSIGMINSR